MLSFKAAGGGRSMWWLWLFPVIGAGVLVGAIVMGIKTAEFMRVAKSGEAQVIGYASSVDDEGTTMYAPILRLLKPALGLERELSVRSNIRKWKVGTKLRVKVDPMDQTDFRIDSADDVYMGPLIMGVIGSVFLIMGLVFVFLFNGPRDEVIWEPRQDLPVEELEIPVAAGQ